MEDDGLRKMQAAVVLGGDDDCSRILKAASLARAGYAPFVLVSGPAAFGVHESDLDIHCAEQHGYPAALFRAFPGDFTSTRGEAGTIGDYLRTQGISHILLVTSNYHTHRAARLFRLANPGLDVRVIPAPDSAFSPENWWGNREGQKTFFLEWTKTITEWFAR